MKSDFVKVTNIDFEGLKEMAWKVVENTALEKNKEVTRILLTKTLVEMEKAMNTRCTQILPKIMYSFCGTIDEIACKVKQFLMRMLNIENDVENAKPKIEKIVKTSVMNRQIIREMSVLNTI